MIFSYRPKPAKYKVGDQVIAHTGSIYTIREIYYDDRFRKGRLAMYRFEEIGPNFALGEHLLTPLHK